MFPIIYKPFSWIALQNSWHRFLYDWKHLVQMDLVRWMVKLGKCLKRLNKWSVQELYFLILCAMNTKNWCYSKATCSWYFRHSHFVCKSFIAVCADYLLIFRDLLTFFFATFFQKQASNDHLTQGNLLKWTLLNEKQNICSLHGAVTFQNILWVILSTFIWHTIFFFAVKESFHGNLVIDCWLSNK